MYQSNVKQWERRQYDLRLKYLDYVNNFLTLERFAVYYELTIEQAELTVRQGKAIYEDRLNRGE